MLASCSSLLKTEPDVTPEETIVASSQPSWITSPPQKANMAYGVGSMEVYGAPDQALKRASDFARADLVSRLKVTISSSNSSNCIMYQ